MIKSSLPLTLRVKRKNGQRSRHLNDANEQERPGPLKQISQQDAKLTKMGTSSWVIQHREMDSFLSLFGDDFIQDFLMKDSCYKMTDKYLLAMTFVYFKRACFTTAEFTRRNFFIALYLANTMEEEEEKSKYEIFPWALGKSWRKHFPVFLQQRDELWARIKYRAAVSRCCCDEVMAINSSHSVWQRHRSEHHGGAQREYDNQNGVIFPRGPFASPISCSQCTHNSKRPHHQETSSFSNKGRARASCNAHSFTSTLTLEVTPPRPTKSQKRQLKAHYHEKAPKSICDSTYGLFMDWINKE